MATYELKDTSSRTPLLSADGGTGGGGSGVDPSSIKIDMRPIPVPNPAPVNAAAGASIALSPTRRSVQFGVEVDEAAAAAATTGSVSQSPLALPAASPDSAAVPSQSLVNVVSDSTVLSTGGGEESAPSHATKRGGGGGDEGGDGPTASRLQAIKVKYQAILHRRNKLRYKVFMLLNGRDPNARAVQAFLVGLIVFNILLFIFSTVKGFYNTHSRAFDALEAISVAIFTLEYAMRIWSVVEDRQYTDPFGMTRRYYDQFATGDEDSHHPQDRAAAADARRDRRRRRANKAAGGDEGICRSLARACCGSCCVLENEEEEYQRKKKERKATLKAAATANAAQTSTGPSPAGTPYGTMSRANGGGAPALLPNGARPPAPNQMCAECTGRLMYVISFMAIIDLFSIFPFYLALIFHLDGFPITTGVRIFRVFRILKTEQYSSAFSSLSRVVKKNGDILVVGMCVSCVLLLLTSSFLYFTESDGHPAEFGSIPACMYIAVLMLTGQGTPTGEFPFYTKIVICLTAFFSVAVFAVPAAMLAWGFESEAKRLVKRRKRIELRKKEFKAAGIPYIPSRSSEEENSTEESSSSSSSSSDDGKKKKKPAAAASPKKGLKSPNSRKGGAAAKAASAGGSESDEDHMGTPTLANARALRKQKREAASAEAALAAGQAIADRTAYKEAKHARVAQADLISRGALRQGLTAAFGTASSTASAGTAAQTAAFAAATAAVSAANPLSPRAAAAAAAGGAPAKSPVAAAAGGADKKGSKPCPRCNGSGFCE